MNFINRLGLFCLISMSLIACTDEQVEEQTAIRPVKAMQVADVSGFSDRSFPGRAKATEQIDLSFDVSGKLTERPVNIGDAIENRTSDCSPRSTGFPGKIKISTCRVAKGYTKF